MSPSATEALPREPPLTPASGPFRIAPSEPIADRLAVVFPAALAAVLCLFEITTRSIGFDEAATVTIAAQHGSALTSAIAHDGGNMSGFYVLLHALIGWFGNDELVIRLPSALASIATVAIIGTIARRLFGARAAFAAGMLTAVSLPLVFWAQNARGYALMVAFVSAAYLIFISIDQTPSRGRWVAYVLLMSLATYSSFVAVLVIPAQLLVLAPRSRRMRLRPFGLALVAIAILCLPLILLAGRRGSGQLFWVPRPTREIEVQVLQSLTSAGLEPSFHATATTTLLMILTAAALIGVAISFALSWRRGSDRFAGSVVLAWVLVPTLLALLYSLFFQPLFLPRNLLMSVPAVALALGAGIGDRRVNGRAALAALAVLVILRGLQLLPSYAVSPEPWRQASAYVLARSRPGDCVAFYPADGRMAFQYYYAGASIPDQRLPRLILPIIGWGHVRTYVEDYATLSPGQIINRGSGCRRLWFVSSHEGQPSGPARSRANRARYLLLGARLARVFGSPQAKQFGYASAIHVQLLDHSPRLRAAVSSPRRSTR